MILRDTRHAAVSIKERTIQRPPFLVGIRSDAYSDDACRLLLLTQPIIS